MSEPIRTILVGVAAPDGPDPVLASALALARAAGAALHVVYALDLPAPMQSAYARAVSLDPATLLELHGESLRATLEAQVGAQADGVPVFCHVVAGAAGERLCEVARDVSADLLVVGATRGTRIWRQFLGGTAEGVVRRATVPVLVVARRPAREVRRVLLAADLSTRSAEAHERGLDVAGVVFPCTTPEVRSLLVVQDAALPFALSGEPLPRVAQRELDRFLRGLRPRGRAVQGRVRVGDPAEEILAEATDWEADLLVLGVHGHPGPGPRWTGRVTGAVLRGAGRNVLVIPTTGTEAGDVAGSERGGDLTYPAGSPPEPAVTTMGRA